MTVLSSKGRKVTQRSGLGVFKMLIPAIYNKKPISEIGGSVISLLLLLRLAREPLRRIGYRKEKKEKTITQEKKIKNTER